MSVPHVAVQAVGPLLLMAKMVIHLSIECKFSECFLQSVEEAALAERRHRVSASQQLVENRTHLHRDIVNAIFCPFYLAAHKFLTVPLHHHET